MASKKYLHEAVILTQVDWEKFRKQFKRHYPNFYSKLHEKYPKLTPSEIRLVTLIKLQFSIKKMAATLGISPKSIIKTRYRLKKKLKFKKELKLDKAFETI